MEAILVNKINNSLWWHVPPKDLSAYKKRGKFLASTFKQAEFYGRPNDVPEKVSVANPICGFSEIEIVKRLFSAKVVEEYKKYVSGADHCADWYEKRIEWDARIYRKARGKGYDAVVLLASNGRKYLKKNRKPHSIELNLLNV